MRRTHKKLLGGSFVALVPLVTAATLVYACTNYVGLLQVWGSQDHLGGAGPCSGTAPNGTCTSTAGVIVTGTDSWNGLQAMTQTVNGTVSYATHGTGSFYVEAEVSGSNSLNQSASSIWYDVNTIPVGYTSHTMWGGTNAYDCMSWNIPNAVATNRGSVQINTSGKIVAAATGSLGGGSSMTLFSSSAGIAGPFSVSGEGANSGGHESGVCLSDSTSTNGNQAPLTLL